MNRREFMLALASVATATASIACKKDARCKHCGMRIDPSSGWRSELVGDDGTMTTFDTPRCALQSWRSGKTPAKAIRVQEYYDRQTRDGNEVRFAIGGDVVGPMGPDLVPVDPPRAPKFIQDHSADRVLRLDEITTEVLAGIGGK
jgi:nitrous oxide reductase accessory protein NosL